MDPDTLHDYASSVSRWAARLLPDDAATAAAAGLLSQAGLLLLADRLPDRLATAYRHAETTGGRLVDAEQELFGITHPEIGAHLLAIWGLPTDLVLAVGRSHVAPDVPATPEPDETDGPTTAEAAVRLARVAAQAGLVPRGTGRPHLDPVPPGLAEHLSALTGVPRQGVR
jgi:HD-like signal output (HDOD) protein